MNRSALVRILFVLFTVFLIGLTVESRYDAQLREQSRQSLRLGLEELAVRVRGTSENLREIIDYTKATAIAKVRAFARMIAQDPELIRRPGALDELAETLDVDELHVSDERGILIACRPTSSLGYDMDSRDQSRAFMPALTNKTFVFVQEPMFKGVETNRIFQYAGVARIDRPGIVQVGFSNQRVEAARHLADVQEIVKTTRMMAGGNVEVESSEGLPPPAEGFVSKRDASGQAVVSLETDCAGYRIRLSAPDCDSWLSRPDSFSVLVICDLILLLILGLVLTGSRQRITEDLAALRTMFGGRFRTQGALRRVVSNPVTVACAIAFLLAVAVGWFVTSRSSLADARARLLAAAADMRDSVDTCADNLLFYQGRAICNHYRTPERMTVDTVQEVMRRYDLDELNVVDENGVVLAGALANVGFAMASNPMSARFNCLLSGVQTYSQAFRAPIEDPSGPRIKYAGVAFPPPAKGYIQMGFREERMKSDIDYWFQDLALNWHIGEKGYYIIADAETGDIVSCGHADEKINPFARGGFSLATVGFDVAAAPKNADEFFEATLFGERCLCLSEVRCFHRLVSVIPMSEVRGGSVRIALLASTVLLCVFVIVVFFMTKLTNLVTSLQGYIAREKENREKDLSVARTIQLSSLPPSFPDLPDWRLFAKMDAAREVGGDFFDFNVMPDGRVFFLIADVSGKGIPAAMFMMKAKTTIRACVFEEKTLADAIVAANDRLAENNDADMFVTAWFGLFDVKTGRLEYANAGHNLPLVKRADGSVEWIRGKRGLVLAAMGGVPYPVETMTLARGDSIFLYTDGVTEAMNAAEELYGEDRLERAFKAAGERFVQDIRRDVDAFVAGAEQSDDITMLALDYKKI